MYIEKHGLLRGVAHRLEKKIVCLDIDENQIGWTVLLKQDKSLYCFKSDQMAFKFSPPGLCKSLCFNFKEVFCGLQSSVERLR